MEIRNAKMCLFGGGFAQPTLNTLQHNKLTEIFVAYKVQTNKKRDQSSKLLVISVGFP